MPATLALGSAQFGSDYGISNMRGRVQESEVANILSLAADHQVTTIDTSPYFGDVERTLGRCWPFPSPFKPQIKTLRLDKGLEWVEQRLRRSIAHMGLTRAQTVIVDHPEDLLGPQGELLWNRLLALKDKGLVKSIGIACQQKDNPRLLAARFRPDLMQVPFSVFDQRLLRDGTLDALAEQGVMVQARSVFLQGLLFIPCPDLPVNLTGFSSQLSKMRRVLMQGGSDPLAAALGFVVHQPTVTSVLVGVTSSPELRAILAVLNRPSPDIDWAALRVDDETMLDPNMWPHIQPPPLTSGPIVVRPRAYAS